MMKKVPRVTICISNTSLSQMPYPSSPVPTWPFPEKQLRCEISVISIVISAETHLGSLFDRNRGSRSCRRLCVTFSSKSPGRVALLRLGGRHVYNGYPL